MVELTWVDGVLGALAFCVLWYLAGNAGWYAEILRIVLFLAALEISLMWWLRNAG